MKILLFSLPFFPSIGGTETVSRVLATEFVQAGHDVCVLTDTPGAQDDDRFPFRVVRCAPPHALLREVKWCDVFFHNSMSLRKAWPLLVFRRPWVIAHQTWLAEAGRKSLKSRIKLLAVRAATSISISSAIANRLDSPSVVIGNPYDETLFRVAPEIERKSDLLFVGNLGRVKGVDVLLRALGTLWSRNVQVHLTIVGGGPDAEYLRGLTGELGLVDAVTFTGPLRGDSLMREYNRHSILVIPSRWDEPFGVIAVEGIACGCVPIGTANGGLPDAIGCCGMVVPNGDVEALAEKIEFALTRADLSVFRAAAPEHLKKHHGKAVADAYLQLMQGVVESHRRS